MTITGASFGADVIVAAEVARVLGKVDDDGRLIFRQTASARDAGRFVRYDWPDATDWPGGPIPHAWDPAPPRFHPNPGLDAGDVIVRLRRIVNRVPAIGIVVGPSVRRQEGRILRGDDGEDASLVGPGRTLNLVEVALPPTSGRAHIVLVHPRDLSVLPARQEQMS